MHSLLAAIYRMRHAIHVLKACMHDFQVAMKLKIVRVKEIRLAAVSQQLSTLPSAHFFACCS